MNPLRNEVVVTGLMQRHGTNFGRCDLRTFGFDFPGLPLRLLRVRLLRLENPQ
jgi:hypothetical protein